MKSHELFQVPGWKKKVVRYDKRLKTKELPLANIGFSPERKP